MSSHLFGWSYPPGCSGPPDDEEPPCEMCGNLVDDCICPTCPVCDEVGRPRCYVEHDLEETAEQRTSRELAKARDEPDPPDPDWLA